MPSARISWTEATKRWRTPWTERCLVTPGPAKGGQHGVDRLAGHVVVDQRLGRRSADRRVGQTAQA